MLENVTRDHHASYKAIFHVDWGQGEGLTDLLEGQKKAQPRGGFPCRCRAIPAKPPSNAASDWTAPPPSLVGHPL